MVQAGKPPAPLSRAGWLRRTLGWVLALHPEWFLAAILVLSGALNIISGLRYKLAPFAQIGPFSSLAQSLAALGSSTQIILGSGLVLVGVGLLWRLASAWAFAVLLVAVTMGVNLIRGQWGASLILPGLMLLALIMLREYFTRRAIVINYLISLIGILSILTYGTFGAYLLGEGFHPRIRDLTSAFYFTIITLGTVGYGDIVPITPETRLFVVSLIMVGLGIFATVLVSVMGPFLSGELRRMFNPRGEPMKQRDHVILVGDGSIASNTARELLTRKIPFIRIIPKDSEPPAPEHPVIRGDASDDQILKDAGVEKARLVIAALDNDGDNAFIALAAKDLNPAVKVLAVVSSANYIRRLRLSGADLVFALTAVGSRILADLVEGKELAQEFTDLLEGKPEQD
jgi:voltage-gated potassium channel